MMGKKKLNTIKSELREAFAAEGVDRAWFDRQIRKLERQPQPNPHEIETLVMLRDCLAEAVGRATKKRPQSLRPRSR